MITTTHDTLANKRLVILGLARQGKALARFAAQQGAEVVVSDLRSAETLTPALDDLSDLSIDFVLGSHPLSLLDECDLLAISGGVPADAPFVQAARKSGITITNDSQEFIRRCPAPTIGITGSAGKSTTTALTGAMGAASERTTHVGGNIGRPLLAELGNIGANDIVVQELSSFQLEIWEQSPHVAAILNITPNHLDRHKTMAVYTDAKANILRFQRADDIAVLPASGLTHLESLVQGRLRHFDLNVPLDDGAFCDRGNVVLRDGYREQVVCGLDEIRLRGQHNVKNVLAACVLADSVGVSAETMRQAINTFTGIPHRLEPIATINGATYINDSIATAPERAIAALTAFDEPLILLAGGKDKDLEWEQWAKIVAQRAKLVILFGALADTLHTFLAQYNVRLRLTETMTAAVNLAHHLAQSGDIVLLSPGGTSFDAYDNFAQRGEHFRSLVTEIRDQRLETAQSPISIR